MAVPKRRPSKSRNRTRKSINMRLSVPTLSECVTCGNKIVPHRVCPKCGYYKGKQYLGLEEIS